MTIIATMLFWTGGAAAQSLTELISINRTNTASGNLGSYSQAMTPNGRFVVFASSATDLTSVTDVNGSGAGGDIFVRDRWTNTTRAVSVNYAGTATGNGDSQQPVITPDGRYVAFQSNAGDLVSNDTNGFNIPDVFVRDLQTNTTTLVSVNQAGTASGNGSSFHPFISDDGRYVVFYSQANNLVAGATNGHGNVYVRDLQTGKTTLLSINRDGMSGGNADSFHLAITPDARYVVFASYATDLTQVSDTGRMLDLFVRDLWTNTTRLVSINQAGTTSGNGETQPSPFPAITPDGHYVAFVSAASDLTATTDNNNLNDVFVRDLQAGVTTLVSVNYSGSASGSGGTSTNPAMSNDGRYVAFASQSGNIVTNDHNGFNNGDVFVRDLSTQTTQLVSINRTGTGSGNGDSFFAPAISADGRYIAFLSRAADLSAIDTPGQNVFVRDILLAQTTRLASINLEGTGGGNNGSFTPLITPGGQYVAYLSLASNLSPNDSNNAEDVFVYTGDAKTTPIDDARFFVRQHYLDFLNREPDRGGLDYWTSQINGTADNHPAPCAEGDGPCVNRRRIGVSAAFYIEQEFQQTGNFVYRLYRATHGARPSFEQFMIDRGRLDGGPGLEASKQALVNEWVTRADFTAKYPSTLSGADFIDALLATVRQGSGVDLSGQRGMLIDDYSTYGSRARIVRAVVDNQVFYNAEYNKAFVLMQYFGYLRREPEQGGYDFWLDVLNNRVPGNYRSMVCAFLTSAEYQLRFSFTVTHNNRECNP